MKSAGNADEMCDEFVVKRSGERSANVRELYVFCEPASCLEAVVSFRPNLHTLVVVGQPEVTSVAAIAELIHLRELWIVECRLKDVRALKRCKKLEKLYLYANEIREIPDLSNIKNLKVLSLARNRICDLTNIRDSPHLREINLAGNEVRRIPNIFTEVFELLHLNLSGNPLSCLHDLESLSALTKLQSVEFDDPLYGECPLVSMCNYRPYLLSQLPSLRKIDYRPVGLEERLDPLNNLSPLCNKICDRHLTSGLLDAKIIKKFFSSDELLHIKHLTITNCSITEIKFEDISLPHLESLDLSKNRISSLRGVNNLKKLHTLCMSNNRLGNRREKQCPTNSEREVLPNLVVLYADHNKIKSMEEAAFPKMPALKYFFLQHNRLSDINGIKDFPSLDTVILDYNRIEIVPEDSFGSKENLKTLMLENNKLTTLNFAKHLSKVEKLFVANNKIQCKRELDSLRFLHNLKELTIVGNPLCQWCNHYVEINEIIDSIKIIDGHRMDSNGFVEVR